MKIASVTEAKNRLSAYLDVVRGGESVLILDRGRPVARLEPAGVATDGDGRLLRLEREGLIRRGSGAPGLPKTPLPRSRGASALRALLEERELDGRLSDAARREGFPVLPLTAPASAP